jgi:tetratricopeptide (TPR) repeat protein
LQGTNKVAILALSYLSISLWTCQVDEPQKKRNPEGERFYHIGNVHLNEARYDEAIKAYQRAIELDSLFAEAHCYLGNAYYHLANNSEAVAFYQRAIRLDSTFIPSYHNLAVAHGQEGRYPEAIAQLQKALRIDPGVAGSYRFLAFFYKEQGDYDRAEETLLQAIKADSTDVQTLQTLGSFYRLLGRGQEAESWLLRAVRLDPTSAESRRELGLIYTNSERYREAEEMLRQAIKIDPGHSKAHHNLATLLSIQGRFEEGQILQERSQNLSRHSDQIVHLKKLLGENPDDLEIYYHLGFSYAELGQYQKALKAFETLLERNPDHVKTLDVLSRLRFKQGELEEAARLATRLIAQAPEHPRISTAFYITGYVQARKGKLGEARQALERVLQMDSTHAEAHNALGTIHLMQGRLQQAERAYKAAIAHNLTTAHYGLGMCYTRQEAFVRAIVQLERAVEIHPTFAKAYLLLGQTYEKQGDIEASLRSYRSFLEYGKEGDQRLGEVKARIVQLTSR